MNLKTEYKTYIFALSITSFFGCAHTPVQQADKGEGKILKSRLEKSERNNGRLTVRVEELEDQIFLLQDRVDSNRIALQRRGVWGQKNRVVRNDAPAPAPESYRQKYGRPTQNRFVRIPVQQPENDQQYEYYDDSTSSPADGGKMEDVVITESEYNSFVKDNGYETTTPEKRKGKTRTGKTRTPQPDVTDEKLLTSKQIKSGVQKKTTSTQKKGLALYKESLAFYRSGNYTNALIGFEAFLSAGPRADYVDNALYWIGECHFGLGSHAKAVSFFNRVLIEQPDGNKIPDSMLKMAMAFQKLGKTQKAKTILINLSQQYPKTNAGKLGAQKLSGL